jgi:hypothetical protein
LRRAAQSYSPLQRKNSSKKKKLPLQPVDVVFLATEAAEDHVAVPYQAAVLAAVAVLDVLPHTTPQKH